MFLILPKCCQYGSDICCCHLYLMFQGLFLTDNNYYVVMADLIANVADVIATVISVYLADVTAKLLDDVISNWFMADVIAMCGWCYCHKLIVIMLADVIANMMADVFTMCGRWNSHLYVMGWCYCPVADGITTWLECGQMLFAQCGRWNKPLSQLL